MTSEQIFYKLKPLIMDHLGVDEKQVIPEANFKEHLGVDSLDLVEIIMEVEKSFDMAFTDNEIERIFTVQDAINLIKRNCRSDHKLN